MRQPLVMFVMAMGLSACVVEGGPKTDPVEGARSRVAIAAEYLQKGELDLAQRHLLRALEINPKSAEAHNIMGALMERDGDPKQAEDHYRKAIALKDDYPQAHFNYGVLLYKQGRYAEAEKQFQPPSEDIAYERRAFALENLGLCLQAMNDKARAQAAFEKALRVDSFMATSALELAVLAFERQDQPVAVVYYGRYRKALGRDSVQSARGLWLGIRLARQGADAAALAGYAQSLKKYYPDSPEYREYLRTQAGGS